ncbi:hypothetical protein Saso_47810 [Streptomyces asoensis]|uniref:Uncharacterized protein n=1 Tax=Streptomyces asoensis TaxID=249586 RepID=A0ABQ3S4T1_9ACTN|nr:hypothetical protein GCM10010496_31880 [Streptomyces asoensis]GHI63131.1 hypothetical protein Saso_47810 [Streptomyces asoensis]
MRFGPRLSPPSKTTIVPFTHSQYFESAAICVTAFDGAEPSVNDLRKATHWFAELDGAQIHFAVQETAAAATGASPGRSAEPRVGASATAMAERRTDRRDTDDMRAPAVGVRCGAVCGESGGRT